MRIALSVVLIFGIVAGLSSAVYGRRGWSGYHAGQCSWSQQPATPGQAAPPAAPGTTAPTNPQ